MTEKTGDTGIFLVKAFKFGSLLVGYKQIRKGICSFSEKSQQLCLLDQKTPTYELNIRPRSILSMAMQINQ